MNIDNLDWQKMELIPAIIQNHLTGQVLMLGYMDKEAIIQTMATKKVTFYSRSKQRLWTKGESSNNFLHLIDIAVDCDNDTLLIQALPDGPTCHKGTTSCFTSAHPFLQNLQELIAKRQQEDGASYTTSLFKAGVKRMAQKVGEEGLEVALAAATNDNEECINESADLIFHLLVLLQNQNIKLSDVINCLYIRHEQKK